MKLYEFKKSYEFLEEAVMEQMKNREEKYILLHSVIQRSSIGV